MKTIALTYAVIFRNIRLGKGAIILALDGGFATLVTLLFASASVLVFFSGGSLALGSLLVEFSLGRFDVGLLPEFDS